MIVGCYSLALNCDAEGCEKRRDGDHAFTAETGGACRRMAREAGWTLDLRTGEALCPRHAPPRTGADDEGF